MWQIVSDSPQYTENVGSLLVRCLSPGDLVSLTGHLGAGKTLLVKGAAAGLGMDPDLVTSPTFAFIHEHEGPIPLYHFDVYRLERPEQLEDLGYEEYFFGSGICFVEWGDVVAAYFPADYLSIHLAQAGDRRRVLQFRAHGCRSRAVLEQLKEVLGPADFGN